MKKNHPNWGEVEVLSTNKDGTSSVRLQSGEVRTVTSEWLTESDAKPSTTKSGKTDVAA